MHVVWWGVKRYMYCYVFIGTNNIFLFASSIIIGGVENSSFLEMPIEYLKYLRIHKYGTRKEVQNK